MPALKMFNPETGLWQYVNGEPTINVHPPTYAVAAVGLDIDPTGAADSAAGIQARLDALDHGQTLYVPPGVYRLTEPLVMPDKLGVSVVGQGRASINAPDGGTVFRPDTNVPAFQLAGNGGYGVGGGPYNLRFADFSVAWADPSGDSNTDQIAFLFQDVASNATWFHNAFERVSVYNAYDCWITKGPGAPTVWDTHWNECAAYGTKHDVFSLTSGGSGAGQPINTWRDLVVQNIGTEETDPLGGRVWRLVGGEGLVHGADVEGWKGQILSHTGGYGMVIEGLHVEWHEVPATGADTARWILFYVVDAVLTLRSLSLGGTSTGAPYGITAVAQADGTGRVTIDDLSTAMTVTGAYVPFYGGTGTHVLGSVRKVAGTTLQEAGDLDATARTVILGGSHSVVKPGSFATDDLPAVGGVGAGALGYDSDRGAPVYSTGTEWRTFGGSSVVDVSEFGAVADGVTDDTEAIAAAIAAAEDRAGTTGQCQTVQLMAGTHLLNYREMSLESGYYAAIELFSGLHLRGAGMGATVLKMADGASAAGDKVMIRNAHLTAGGDHDITLSDFELDGNGGVNSTDLVQGISIVRARSVHFDRVRVRNVHGTDPYLPGETFHFVANQCVDVTYVDCEVVGDAGTQGSGFSDNVSTNVRYVGCTARGMSAGMGFASWYATGLQHVGSRAYQCGANGINVEFGIDVTLTGCVSGGQASDLGGYVDGLELDDSLGNSNGIVINSSIAELVGCVARHNVNGLIVVDDGSTFASATISGGRYSDNSAVGITMSDKESTRASRLSRETVAENNGTVNYSFQAAVDPIGYVGTVESLLNAPTLSSGAVIHNDYPFAVTVIFDRDTDDRFFTLVDGNNWNRPYSVTIGPGSTIQSNYPSTTTWLWTRA